MDEAGAGSGDLARRAIEALFRQEYGRILATLIRRSGDFELAEEALQDALTSACQRWPADGLPERPAAWISTVAGNRLVDHMRRRKVSQEKLVRLSEELRDTEDDMVAATDDAPVPDDRLRLIFTCCHPALAHEAQVALTLNALCGLTVGEIARAFLIRETTMAQRLVRAKRKIREAGIPYEVPSREVLGDRLPAVLAVVYLVFNAGYSSGREDDLVRLELTNEAIRLGYLLQSLVPDEPEVHGLLALMLLQDSRSAARLDEGGELVLLEAQDRSRWDLSKIEEGKRLLEDGLARGRAGPFQIQAAIAALHADAASAAETDWDQILLLFDELMRVHPSPVVALNRAVAIAMTGGPERGLEALEEIDSWVELESYVYLHSTRADFLRRLGRQAEARAAYEHALTLVGNRSERAFLERRLEQLRDVR